MSLGRLAYFLLGAGVLLCLLQIWLPAYYLTGDGPCHVYNAAILKDMLAGKQFYTAFFQLNVRPNPNWMSTLLLMGCLTLFKGVIAEKVFLTIYALTMMLGILLLAKRLNKEVTLWLLVVFIFVFHHTLSKGFYNFSLGTALFPFMVWAWLAYLNKKSVVNTLTFFLFSLLVFFTQLLPFIIGWISCFAFVVSYTLAGEQRKLHRPAIFWAKNTLALLILTSPFLLALFWFTSNEGGLKMGLKPHFYPLRELAEFKYLISTSAGERIYAALAGITLLTAIVAGLIQRVRTRTFHRFDGFLLALFVMLVLYVLVPEKFMGRDILITMRLQLFIFITGAMFVAYSASLQVKNAAGAILFLCFLGLFRQRINCQIAAGTSVQECAAMMEGITPGTVVLPLCFSPEGRDTRDRPVAQRNYIFNHATQYMGCDRDILFLDNYEAMAGYFPLLWHYTANPYVHLSMNEGIEGLPPCANISRYEQSAHKEVRYIIRLFYNRRFLQKGHYKMLDDQINANYHLVKTSTTGAYELFERNTINSSQIHG